MPFTFAHPAVVLPFRRFTKFSLTALIIGSITPDFEYFFRMRVKSIYSHTWCGAFWFDIPLGIGLYFVYHLLLKDTLIEHLPQSLHRRFAAFKNPNQIYVSLSGLVFLVLSVSIGIFSHLIWDAFTHSTGYFVHPYPLLSKRLSILGHRFYLYKLLQHGSTVIGTAILLLTIFFLPANSRINTRNNTTFWLMVMVAMVLVTIIRVQISHSVNTFGNILVTGIAGGCIGIVVAVFLAAKKPI